MPNVKVRLHKFVILLFALVAAVLSNQSAMAEQAGSRSDENKDVMSLSDARDYFLERINRDRASKKLKPVALDEAANCAAQHHADEMANKSFNAHWHPDGTKPPQHYTWCNGLDYVGENSQGWSPSKEWEFCRDSVQTFTRQQIEDAEKIYFNEKPPNDGHRKNVLAPEHTHVGIGIARVKMLHVSDGYESVGLVTAEEFVNQYGKYTVSANFLNRGQPYIFSGELDPSVKIQSLTVFREDMPQPIPLEELRSPAYVRGYTLPNERQLAVFPAAYTSTPQAWLRVDGHHFDCQIIPGQDWKRGLYYFLMFADSEEFGHVIPISMRVLELQ